MRITYVTETYPPEINGVALTAARAVGYLRACGHDVELVRPRQAGDAAGSSRRQWLTAGWPIPLYPALRFGWASAAAFGARWADVPPDLVHVATPGPLGVAALVAAQRSAIPATADFRTNFHAYCSHYGLAWAAPWVLGHLRRVHARAELTFVPTSSVRDALVTQGFGRLDVVGRGVDAHQFSPAWRSSELRASWGAQAHDPVFAYVGRIAGEKNVQLALTAFREARKHCPAARMVVVGDGPQRARLQREFADVHFAGMLRGDALARAYASSDIFLFPSRTDTFGNVTLEAMASGLVVVAFDVAAAREHLRDGVNACLAPMSSPPAFVAAALRALAEASPGSVLRRRAREAALGADWRGVLSAFERRLCDVAATRPMPHAAVA